MAPTPYIDALLSAAIPSDPCLAPGGESVVYVVTTQDLDADRPVRRLWRVSTAEGAVARPLTSGPDDSSPAWSPDGSTLAFVRRRRPASTDLDDRGRRRATSSDRPARWRWCTRVEPRWNPDRVRRGRRSRGPSRHQPDRHRTHRLSSGWPGMAAGNDGSTARVRRGHRRVSSDH